MVYKENWACAQCGMTSSRKEGVIRHIVNPRIHNGRAQAVPYTDYLAGLRDGIYLPSTAHLYRKRRLPNQLPDEQSGETLFERIDKRVEEKLVDNIAERMVKPSFNQLEPSLAPIGAKSAFSISQPPPLTFRPESIFGIAGYICENCLVIKPKIILFTNSVDNQFITSEIHPVRACHRQGSQMSKEDETFYLNYNKRYGFGTALIRWVRGYWSQNMKMKVIAIRLTCRADGTSPIFGVRISMSDDRALSEKKTVLLRYDESLLLDLTNREGVVPAERVEDGSSIITEAIKSSEYVIEGESQLSAFLRQTKFSTFAFFRINQSKSESEYGKTPIANDVYLIAALPEQMTKYKKFTIEAMGNKQAVLS